MKKATIAHQIVSIIRAEGGVLTDPSGRINSQIRERIAREYKRNVSTQSVAMALLSLTRNGVILRDANSRRTYAVRINGSVARTKRAPAPSVADLRALMTSVMNYHLACVCDISKLLGEIDEFIPESAVGALIDIERQSAR